MNARWPALSLVIVALAGCATAGTTDYIPLFNGEDLEGWTPSAEDPGSFSASDGVLIVKGGRGHLFYSGDMNDGLFRDFELRLEVKTFPGANSGVYFHTRYQDSGWPVDGYECQVNSTHRNSNKTGSLFGVKNIVVLRPGQKPSSVGENIVIDESPTRDGEWFSYTIRVEGRRIVTMINGQTLVDYTEPPGGPQHPQFAGRKLGEGTFAIQAHDPKSEVHFRNIRVKTL